MCGFGLKIFIPEMFPYGEVLPASAPVFATTAGIHQAQCAVPVCHHVPACCHGIQQCGQLLLQHIVLLLLLLLLLLLMMMMMMQALDETMQCALLLP